LGLIWWLGEGIVGSTLLARPYLLGSIVMVAEMLGLICSAHQLLALVSPSFVLRGL
jgi:hypothetical protein